MRPTERWLAFSATLVLGLGASSIRAGSTQCAFHVFQSTATFGQTAEVREGLATRANVNKLLAQAREAIAEGAFDRAEALLAEAEKSNVRYTLFHRDTPKRVRRDLEKARAQAKSPKLPSERFQPQASTVTQTGSADPFLSRAQAGGPALGESSSPAGADLDQPIDEVVAQSASNSSRTLPEWPFGNRATSPSPADAAAPMDGPETAAATSVSAETNVQVRKQQALQHTRKAREALARGDLEQADQRAQQAVALAVPDSLFTQGEDHPWLVALQVRDAHKKQTGVVTADASSLPSASAVQHSLYRSSVPVADANRAAVRLAADEQPAAATATAPAATTPAATTPAATAPTATAPAATVDRLPAPTEPAAPEAVADEKGPPSLIERTADEQQLLTRKVSADVLGRLAESRTLLQSDPKRSLQLLHETRAMVASSGVDADARGQLLRRIDRSVRDAEKYIQDNRTQIELDERNREVLEAIDRKRLLEVEVGQKLADLVEQFNQLRDERRFEEMEVVAKRARELAPDEPIVQQLWQEARFIRRIMNNEELVERKENGVFQSLFLVEESAVPPEDGAPYRHPDAKVWEQLSESRARRQQQGRAHRSERELEIERKLQSPVTLEFTATPLAEVINHLTRLTSVNIHLDERGLAEEGINSDEPVTIKLSGEISLKSALNLILEPLHLDYMIKDEVLKITSEHLRDGETYTETYVVADLVIPIPNFTPGSHFGLQGAINDAHAALGRGTWAGGVAPPMALVAGQNGDSGSAMINPQLLAQAPSTLTGGLAGSGVPFAAGPGGLGGGVQADFDSLIELIVNTIEPDSWDETGGPGSVQPFETNLSLVVSQTQDVHEQIVDLLEQLRRLQDLQVTIEVRFIRLSDDFFERIGIDFDFSVVKPISTDVNNRPVSPSATVGLIGSDPPIFTADLDIPFTQNSFSATQPAFGGFDPGSAANFGFAILSDIEAYFLVQATQGDTRSNVLNAPKVTLFNGQQAFVSDTSQSPFVISVIPVVGDFAAAQQPVIVVLSEGTSLSVQAVVSPDRRYVRLTLVPLFSQIGEVDEFTFEGSSTSTRKTSKSVDEDDETVVSESDDKGEVRQGTTVQLPTFAFVTVVTTVSVPDGGTVLLGGIKRLAEGRTEVGVPLLSKIPYVDRLFRNVSVGRETESLMMMVTPRIIIQEEEEERLLGVSSE